VRLAYVRHGDPSGVPVLLLHPWSESLGCFDRLVPLLPATVHALAMDQRGHGDADKPAGGYALTDFAADVEAFMDAMVLRSAVLLGSWSGGYLAQQVAIGIPDRVTGLVLVGAPRSLRGRPSFADEVERLTDPVDRAWVERSLAWFPRFHDIPDWYIQDRVDDGVRVPAHAWRQALAGLTTAWPPTQTGTIAAPTLIIWEPGTSYCPGRRSGRWQPPSPAHDWWSTRTPGTLFSGSSQSGWQATWQRSSTACPPDCRDRAGSSWRPTASQDPSAGCQRWGSRCWVRGASRAATTQEGHNVGQHAQGLRGQGLSTQEARGRSVC
jgi:pimeloyl-ACP methyl ester carboxylesterase